MKLTWLLFLLTAFLPSHAVSIIHTDTIDTVLQHIEEQTDLIVVDLDETIFTLEHGEHWLAALCAEKKITHFDKVKDFYIWHAMQDEHHLLESHAPQIIAELQSKGYKVIALTARNSAKFIEHTAQLLLKLGIDFSRSGLAGSDVPLAGLPHFAFYHKGIVSCGNNEKGAVLARLIDTLKLSPTKIIFMDDKLHHLESVQLHMCAKNIPFVGIRYGRTDGTQKVLSRADHLNYHAWFDGLPGMFATS
jgi:phosphoglycolate phosphatase-like HAD superfamily hydrolase